MKWSLQQLFKYNGKPFSFNETIDLKEYILNIDDILDISDVQVKGTGQNIDGDRYLFEIVIDVVLTLEDAVTLDPVIYPVHIETTEIFDKNYSDDEDINLIEKNTIDLKEVVWENILVEKPIRVTNSSDK